MPDTIPALRKKTLKKLGQDPEAAARAIQLVYVSCKDEGIERVAAGKGYKYILENKKITDKPTLKRILSLKIPPAGQNVGKCRQAKDNLQATGLDVRPQKKYRYPQL